MYTHVLLQRGGELVVDCVTEVAEDEVDVVNSAFMAVPSLSEVEVVVMPCLMLHCGGDVDANLLKTLVVLIEVPTARASKLPIQKDNMSSFKCIR